MSDENETVLMSFEKFENFLAHYGVLRKSGRYPWGSGENAYQRHRDFLGYVDKLSKQGLSDADIAKGLLGKDENGKEYTSTDLRALKSIAKTAKREADIITAQRLQRSGMSNVAIGKEMGINESSVRSLLNPSLKERNDILATTASFLKSKVDEAGYIDVGAGVENHLGISATKKNTAIAMLEEEGYKKFYVPVPQLGTGKDTNMMVLAKPEVTFPELMKNQDKIKSVAGYSEDGGRSFKDILPPVPLSSKRIAVRYGDEGGADMDGVIQLRRGVDDLSLGGKNYAQVRISVDGTHYLKGMAMYSDKMPDGVDVVFNTNKSSTGNKLDAMKKLNSNGDGDVDPDMPFGSIVRNKFYTDPKTGKSVQSPINTVSDNEEGRWNDWSRNLSSQMLSKQSPALAKQQLDVAYRRKKEEYDEIMKLTNPAVRKKLLDEFSDGADAAAVHLKAAGLPRTRTQVLLPINTLKDNEIYAPNFRNGEKVVLIRHPHGGIFEIPELTVNNRNKEALSSIKQAKDAVGINARVAQRLSGADFDGDTVLVIPNNSGAIKTAAPLARLKNFDPQTVYRPYDGMKTIDGGTWNAKERKVDYGPKGKNPGNKQLKMGDISNLITDMTIKKASYDEIARAVAHSMVVIDAEKHSLNVKQSAVDHGIAELKKKYQAREDGTPGGASTLISRAKSPTTDVGMRKPRSAKDGGPIDPKTGEKMWTYTNETYTVTKVRKNGEVIEETKRKLLRPQPTRLGEAKDAYELSSGTPMEAVYAEHSNRLKSLANNARKASYDTKPTPYSPSAKATYSEQVKTLNAKLNVAQMNAPLERKAQLLANSMVSAKRQANPDMEASDLKKIKSMALEEARARTGAGKQRIQFTQEEWNAVQAGAISNNKLTAILNNADMDQVRELATPRARTVMTDAKIRQAEQMLARGYTQAEIADRLGVPASTLNDAIK